MVVESRLSLLDPRKSYVVLVASILDIFFQLIFSFTLCCCVIVFNQNLIVAIMPKAITMQKIEGGKPGKVYYPYVSSISLYRTSPVTDYAITASKS